MLPTHRPPTHPGEMLLKEFLEPLDVSQAEAALACATCSRPTTTSEGTPKVDGTRRKLTDVCTIARRPCLQAFHKRLHQTPTTLATRLARSPSRRWRSSCPCAR